MPEQPYRHAANPSAPSPQVTPLGDRALLLHFNHIPVDQVTPYINGYRQALQHASHACIIDLVPAFESLCVHYDPLVLLRAGNAPSKWMAQLTTLPYQPVLADTATTHVIPVCYELGLDLAFLADTLASTPAAVAKLHADAEYEVVMMGFAPGFAYMRGLPLALQRPRRATPRIEVPAGSVAIAEDMCGIYPRVLPGGWHIVGRTPVTLFDLARPQPCLLQAGDRVRFQPVTHAQFEAWSC